MAGTVPVQIFLLTQPKIVGLYHLQLELKDHGYGFPLAMLCLHLSFFHAFVLSQVPGKFSAVCSALGRVPWSGLLQGNEVPSSPLRLLEAVRHIPMFLLARRVMTAP